MWRIGVNAKGVASKNALSDMSIYVPSASKSCRMACSPRAVGAEQFEDEKESTPSGSGCKANLRCPATNAPSLRSRCERVAGLIASEERATRIPRHSCLQYLWQEFNIHSPASAAGHPTGTDGGRRHEVVRAARGALNLRCFGYWT